MENKMKKLLFLSLLMATGVYATIEYKMKTHYNPSTRPYLNQAAEEWRKLQQGLQGLKAIGDTYTWYAKESASWRLRFSPSDLIEEERFIDMIVFTAVKAGQCTVSGTFVDKKAPFSIKHKPSNIVVTIGSSSATPSNNQPAQK